MAKKKNREPMKPIESENETDETFTQQQLDESEPTFSLSKRPSSSSKPKKSSKKHKTIEIVETTSSTPKPQRLFSNDDEIVILNGLIEFEAAKKVSPSSDMDSFLEFIKHSLRVDVSKKQLQEKVRKMRLRFVKNKGKDFSSAKPHEKSIIELSEKLWGSTSGDKIKEAVIEANENEGKEEAVGNANTGRVKRNASKKKEVAADVDNANVRGNASKKKKNATGSGVTGKASKKGKKEAVVKGVSNGALGSGSRYVGLSNEEKLLRMGAELFGGAGGKITGWEDWKKLDREEMELSVKQLDVKRARMKLVLDTMK